MLHALKHTNSINLIRKTHIARISLYYWISLKSLQLHKKMFTQRWFLKTSKQIELYKNRDKNLFPCMMKIFQVLSYELLFCKKCINDVMRKYSESFHLFINITCAYRFYVLIMSFNCFGIFADETLCLSQNKCMGNVKTVLFLSANIFICFIIFHITTY